jgi:hypothetical protein
MHNGGPMNKETKNRSGAPSRGGEFVRPGLASALAGDVLAVVFGLLFLFQCMLLPLVGKAAMGGSGSPGAGPADTLHKNIAFFSVMLVLTLAAGGAAFYSKWLRRQLDGTPFPKATAGLLVLTVGMLLAFITGLLGI